MATDNFEAMSDRLYECKWYELPIGLQKYFVLMIQNTQKPIHYSGFGVLRLTLETFTGVGIKKSASKFQLSQKYLN